MKHVFLSLILVICLVAQKSMASRDFLCPSNITCAPGEILSADGKCYACDSPERITYCSGHYGDLSRCPNRLKAYPKLSVLKCSQTEDKINDLCLPKCKPGYIRGNSQGDLLYCYKIDETSGKKEYDYDTGPRL